MSEFQREERFIVIKRKHLNEEQEDNLRMFMARNRISTVECVVVESDWPEYETVWRMIEDRVTGRPVAPLVPQPICLPPDEADIRMVRHAELPTCPFCWGTPVTFTRFFEHSGIYQSYIHCSHCMAQVFVNARDRTEARDKAIAAWKLRVTAPVAAQLAKAASAFCLDIADQVPDDHMIETIAWSAADFRKLATGLKAAGQSGIGEASNG